MPTIERFPYFLMTSSQSKEIKTSISMMSVEDSEWELADVDTDEEDGGWVIAGAVDDRTVIGVFLPSNARPSFVSFDPDFSSSSSSAVIPSSFSVMSASGGLVLSRGPWSSYRVSDPAGGSHLSLPRPPAQFHPRESPSVLIRNGNDYAVVTAVGGPVYTFDVFTSATGRWISSVEKFALGAICPNSGVSAAGCAYWRTVSPAGIVVEYDFGEDLARVFPPPPGCWEARWQLGCAGGRLGCVMVTQSEVVGYKLGRSGRWRIAGSIGVHDIIGLDLVSGSGLMPVRFECGRDLEVVLSVDGKMIVVVDLEKGKVVNAVEIEGTMADCVAQIVPCVGRRNQ